MRNKIIALISVRENELLFIWTSLIVNPVSTFFETCSNFVDFGGFLSKNFKMALNN